MNPGTPWPGHSSRRAGCRATAAAVRTIRAAMRTALASVRVTTTPCGVRSSSSPARSAAVRNPYRPAARRSRPDPSSRGFAAGGVSERRARIDGLTGRATGFGSGPLSPDRLGPDGRTVAVDADTLILGIETSCDDTGAAVVTGDGRVLGEAKTSQDAIHAPWGGVVPNLAQEAHKAAIDDVVTTALRNAGVDASRLDAVAVTVGPGLSMCLRVGVVAAQDVCAAHNIPIVPVHHMEAHGLVARLAGGTDRVRFPFLALLVSGGHNQLILTRGVGDHVILGSTLDDALGEAYDKTARLLGLDVGGGGGPRREGRRGRGAGEGGAARGAAQRVLRLRRPGRPGGGRRRRVRGAPGGGRGPARGALGRRRAPRGPRRADGGRLPRGPRDLGGSAPRPRWRVGPG